MSTKIADTVDANPVEPDAVELAATAIATETKQPEKAAPAADTTRRALGSATITVTQLLVPR